MNNNFTHHHVLLVGPGKIGMDYYKVLKAHHVNKITVVGRNKESSEYFENKTGTTVEVGLENFLDSPAAKTITAAIVAVNIEELSKCTQILIKRNIKQILLEKPAGIDLEEIESLSRCAKEANVNIMIGYNRRFYTSVQELKRRITAEGGLLSIHFDFTEWPHTIVGNFNNKKVLNNWIYANSCHVIDLAFYLAGKPVQWSTFVSGSLDWHPKGAVFTGSGITQTNVLFSYHANWLSPGRWGIEACTKDFKYFLRPLEQLQIQKHKSVSIDMVEIDYSKDTDFKPGLFYEVEEFLTSSKSSPAVTIHDHLQQTKLIFDKISTPVNSI